MTEAAPVRAEEEPVLLVLASPERRRLAAIIDLFLIVALWIPVFYVAKGLHGWEYFLALGVLWFLVEVPAVAVRGRTVGHVATATRVVAADLTQPPGWIRALLRWATLVPAAVANRLGAEHAQDQWSRTEVVFLPYGLALEVSAGDEGHEVGWTVDPRLRQRARQFEQSARERPRRYRARVALVAGGGYAFLVLLAALQLGGAAAIIAAIVWWHVAALAVVGSFTLLAYFWKTVSSLALDRSLPSGTVLLPESASRLFELVRDLRARLGAARIHVLVLDSSRNAGVRQLPRVGPFGPYRNILVLGFPLLESLRPEEAEALLAHELAHLQRRHGRLGAWVHRLRDAYPRLLDRLEHEGLVAVVVMLFFEWYTPYFDVSSLALSRAHEYEADRLAAEIVGPAVVAAMLRRTDLLQRSFDALLAKLAEELEPTGGRTSSDEHELDDVFATHPDLAQRLTALGVDSPQLPPVVRSAAEELLPVEWFAQKRE